jgi:hypothetical protein
MERLEKCRVSVGAQHAAPAEAWSRDICRQNSILSHREIWAPRMDFRQVLVPGTACCAPTKAGRRATQKVIARI